MLLRNQKTLLATTILVSTPFVMSSSVSAAAAPPPGSHLEEIVVSGSYEGRKLGETILGTTILNQEDIQRQLDGSIGETLRRLPGISSTFFGPGASRPIIRGLGGDRIRVLDNGLGSIDASSTSPDHATAVEPALAERIEVLRGTAMLMYGNSAAGGVVNVIDGRIPSKLPENGFEAAARYGHSTVNNGNEGTASINAHLGSIGDTDVVFHIDGSYRKTKDFDIPGFAESEALHEQEEHEEEGHGEEEGHDEHEEEGHDEREGEAFGIVENSATKTRTGSAGLSFIFPNGFIGMNVKINKSDYGVPAGHEHGHGHEEEGHEEDGHDEEEEGHDEHEEEGHEEETPVTIDLDQVRFDVNGEYSGDFGFFKKAKFRFGYADYEHIELEGAEVGTVFKNEGWESRLDLIDEGGENWGGASAIHYRYRDFSAVGEEAFVPATTSKHFGLYTVKEYHAGSWHVDGGVRLEHTKYNAPTVNSDRTFNSFSGSFGVGYDISQDLFFGVNLSRTERAPSTEELFSNGPHLATNAFERGDSSLGKETSLGMDATLSFAIEKVSFVLNGFYTSYDDFIYEAETGEEEDGLEVFQFQANNAKFYGFEAKAEAHVGSFETATFGAIDLHVDGQIDVVRAELDISGNDNLPRIPPLSTLVGIETRSELFDLRTEVEYAAEQNRVTEHELPTDDYVLWNTYLTVRPFDNKDISFEVRGTNLTNNEARQHTSFLKDNFPLPGRNVKASIRVKF